MDANVEHAILKTLLLIQEDIREIKVELAEVKSDLDQVKNELAEVKDRLTKLEDTVVIVKQDLADYVEATRTGYNKLNKRVTEIEKVLKIG